MFSLVEKESLYAITCRECKNKGEKTRLKQMSLHGAVKKTRQNAGR